MISAELYRYLEAAYLYYLRPELGTVLMTDHEWDALGRKLFAEGQIEHEGSLFRMKAGDYPKTIVEKYATK